MEFKDYYQVLGVARDATAEAIKKAYRQAARKYHRRRKLAYAEQRMPVNEATWRVRPRTPRGSTPCQGRRQGERSRLRPWDAGSNHRNGAEGVDARLLRSFPDLVPAAASGRGRRTRAVAASRRGMTTT